MLFAASFAPLWGRRNMRPSVFDSHRPIVNVCLIIVVCILTIWAGYRFSSGPMVNPADKPYKAVDRIVGEDGMLHDAVYFMLDNAVVPSPEFYRTLASTVLQRNQKGHAAILFGQKSTQGWWYYYPVIILLKTPLPFLLLFFAGFYYIIRAG